MKIKDIIDGHDVTSPKDWADLEKELKILEFEIKKAHSKGETKRYRNLSNFLAQFKLTDVGYLLIRGY